MLRSCSRTEPMKANTLQQNRTDEANTLQQNRVQEANNLQYKEGGYLQQFTTGSWGGYLFWPGLWRRDGYWCDTGCAAAAALAISVAGNPYYYANGVGTTRRQGRQYAVVPPPQSAVVSAPPPSCSNVYSGTTSYLDCGGAYYSNVPTGYKVIRRRSGRQSPRCQAALSIRTSRGQPISFTVARITGRSTAAAA